MRALIPEVPKALRPAHG